MSKEEEESQNFGIVLDTIPKKNDWIEISVLSIVIIMLIISFILMIYVYIYAKDPIYDKYGLSNFNAVLIFLNFVTIIISIYVTIYYDDNIIVWIPTILSFILFIASLLTFINISSINTYLDDIYYLYNHYFIIFALIFLSLALLLISRISHYYGT